MLPAMVARAGCDSVNVDSGKQLVQCSPNEECEQEQRESG
jgi:hypothetical protein